jgi:hypothetical protein
MSRRAPDCALQSVRCLFKLLFTDWQGGYLGNGQVTGAPAADTTPCQNDILTIGASHPFSPRVPKSSNGAIE